MHDIVHVIMGMTLCTLQEVRRRYPNPVGIPYTDHIPGVQGMDMYLD